MRPTACPAAASSWSGAAPTGVVGAGIYLSEFGRGRYAQLIRFCSDLIAGLPSIVVGVFVYGLAVMPFKRFSALAGGLALGVMMIPLIMRTTEELLLLVPSNLREGALALGATRARAVFTVVLPAALPGIMTGILLALARIAGETAPLLFTALNNQFFTTSLGEPMASLPVTIFKFAMSPFTNWQELAWAGVFLITLGVLALNILARVLFRHKN